MAAVPWGSRLRKNEHAAIYFCTAPKILGDKVLGNRAGVCSIVCTNEKGGFVTKEGSAGGVGWGGLGCGGGWGSFCRQQTAAAVEAAAVATAEHVQKLLFNQRCSSTWCAYSGAL